VNRRSDGEEGIWGVATTSAATSGTGRIRAGGVWYEIAVGYLQGFAAVG